MELSGVIALALVGFVSGTPYGYGVKSGAVAKAEANAASGAFGVLPAIPLSIPSSGGYSGSFSKSSSSSFASSSASSSSSSSSFSFSGTGANGIAGIGCPSTGCKNGAPSSWHGSTSNGLANSGALASAAAGAVAGSSSFDNGGNTLCKGNNCASSGNTGSNCAFGQCSASTQTGNIPNGQGSLQETSYNNDSEDNKVKYNQNGNYGGLQTSSDGKCSQGKCGPGAESSEEDIFVPLGPTNDATSTHQKPSEHLTTPNLEPACTDHNCNQGSSGSHTNGKPLTSYNVPILGSNPSSSDSNGYSTGPGPGAPHTNLPGNCANGLCSPASRDQRPSGLSHSSYPSQSPSTIPSGCSGSNCDNYGINENSAGLPHGTSQNNNLPNNCANGLCDSASAIPTSGNQKPSVLSHGSYPSQPSPALSSGCLGSNCDTYTPSVTKLPSDSQSSNCNSFNCAEYSGASNDISGSNSHFDSSKSNTHTGSLGFSIPNSKQEPNPSHHTYPKHPSSSLKPNSAHHNIAYQNNYASPVNAVVHPESKPLSGLPNVTPTYTGGFGGPAGSISSGVHVSSPANSPDYSIQQPTPSHSVNAAVHTESKPVSGLPSETPTYTGGFGGPAGSITSGVHVSSPANSPGYSIQHPTPSQQTIPSQQPTSSQQTTPSQQAPSVNGGYTSTGSVNIGTPSASLPTLKPNTGYITPNQNLPSHTSGFATELKPSTSNTNHGTTYPDHVGVSLTPSTVSSHEVPKTNGVGANAGIGTQTTQPISGTHSHDIPSYTGGFGGSAGPIQGNGYSKPGVLIPDKVQPAYTGSFGGSAGTFDTGFPVGSQLAAKPNQGKVPSSTNNLPHSSNFGATVHKTGVNVNSGSNDFSHEHDILSKPSGSLVPPIDNTPHGGSIAGSHGSHIASHPTTALKPGDEEKKLPTYTGGFGGPGGLLKPHDYSLPTQPLTPHLNNENHCATGACHPKNENTVTGDKQAYPSNTASAGASASANAKAIAYSGGFGGPPGLLKPFDDGKQYKNGKVDNSGVLQPGSHDHSVGNLNTPYENKVPSASLSSANNGAQDGALANAGAQANAVAFAGSAAFGANHNGAKGCNTGCGSSPGTGGSFASSGSLGLSNTGLNELNNVAGASASSKSIAGASAGGLAVGRSFATSLASAHASAGASVKGGYGR